jgi:hypothetical protein
LNLRELQMKLDAMEARLLALETTLSDVLGESVAENEKHPLKQ